MDNELITKCESWSSEIRKDIIELSHGVGKKGVHLGSSLSVVEILATLYGGVLKYDPNNPTDEKRDFFVLSKGHAYMAFYTMLCRSGFFTSKELKENFMTDGGIFPIHPIKNINKGIEFSGGSLGMGFSFAVGKAYALKLDKLSNEVYALLGDGECDEGIVWEAFLSASQLKLSNLTAIIDNNKFQQDGPTEEIVKIDFVKMVKACGWNVIEVDGHSIRELLEAFNQKFDNELPKCIIANTIKGKGISFMENDIYWHHAFLSEKQYIKAIEELNR